MTREDELPITSPRPLTEAEQAFADAFHDALAKLWIEHEEKAQAAGLDHDTAELLMAQETVYTGAGMARGHMCVHAFAELAECLYDKLETELSQMPGTALQ